MKNIFSDNLLFSEVKDMKNIKEKSLELLISRDYSEIIIIVELELIQIK